MSSIQEALQDGFVRFPELADSAVIPPGEGAVPYRSTTLGLTARTPAGVHPLPQGLLFRPTGTHDATRFIAALAVHATLCPGAPIYFDAGTYDWDVVVNLRSYSGLVIHLHPKAALVSSGGVAFFVIMADSDGAGGDTTLTTGNTVGTSTFSTAAPITVGARIRVQSQAGLKHCEQWYTVKACSGSSSPYTITTERPVTHQFATSDKVYIRTAAQHPERIEIHGHGATLDSRNNHDLEWPIECMGAEAIVLDGINVLAEGDSISASYMEGMQFDTGCYNCVMRDCTLDKCSFGAYGSDRITFDHVRSTNADDAIASSIGLWDASRVTLVNCEGYNPSSHSGTTGCGLVLGTNGGNWGCKDITLIGCTFAGCVQESVRVSYTDGLTMVGCRISGGASDGINIASTASGPISIIGCSITEVGGTGIIVQSNSCNVDIVNAVVTANTHGVQVSANSNVRFTGYVGHKTSPTGGGWAIAVNGTGRKFFSGTFEARQAGVALLGGSNIKLSGVVNILSGASYGVHHQLSTSRVSLDNLEITGTGQGVLGASGSSCKLGSDVKNNASDPWGGFNGTLSRGVVTLSGATPSDYAFYGLLPDPLDLVQVTRNTSAGTPSAGFSVVKRARALGTVDLTTLTYPTDFGTKTLSVIVDGSTKAVTFASPADAAAVVSTIQTAVGAAGTVSLDATNHLRIVSATSTAASSVVVTSGTLAAATIGFTSAASNTLNCVEVTGTAGDTSVMAIKIG